MEEAQNQPQSNFQEQPLSQESRVSFPSVDNGKGKNGAKTLLIVGILILIGVLGYVIYRSASEGSSTIIVASPTPYQDIVTQPTPEGTPIATSTPSATIEKDSIKIQIQNGTGVSGDAAYLQEILDKLGYTEISTGNSADQTASDTEVSFSSSVPASVVTEITNKLNSLYQKVVKTSSTSTSYDIVIITGTKKGSTITPTASPVE